MVKVNQVDLTGVPFLKVAFKDKFSFNRGTTPKL
jgi:hypothetical protein